MKDLKFGDVIDALELGKRVSRTEWNKGGVYLKLVGNSEYGFTENLNDIKHSVDEYLPWIGIKTADNKFVPWSASQTDILAKDWHILD